MSALVAATAATGLALVGGAAAGLAARALWFEPRRLVVTRATVCPPRWPARARPLRIAVLSDLHAGGPHMTPARLAALVARTNAERPDLVALLGDYVFDTRLRTSFVPPEAVADALAGLRAPLGAFAVLGDHDWALDGPRVRRALEAAGIVVLENEARRIEVADGAAMWVAGAGNAFRDRADLRRTLRAIADGAAAAEGATAEGATAEGDDAPPVILLTHSPDLFPEVPERVAVTLAGHTHGGQVAFPLVGPPYVPSRFGRRYLRGHITEGGRHLFVSTGIGCSMLPVRFRVPPELAVLTLRGDAGAESGAHRGGAAAPPRPPLAAARARPRRLRPALTNRAARSSEMVALLRTRIRWRTPEPRHS